MRIGLATIAALALAAALPTSANHTTCSMTTSQATFQVGSGDADGTTLYVVTETSEWIYAKIYAEANLRDGLQRDDLTKDDTCGGTYSADALMI